MANLADGDRLECWAEYMQDISGRRDVMGGALTKVELRAAVDAIDSWLNTNAAALNSAIPQPARGVLTQSQKARLLTHVVNKRYVKGA